ncbi:hypothetical protein BH10BAC3_BH10BAC3_30100 [soil metagenome]
MRFCFETNKYWRQNRSVKAKLDADFVEKRHELALYRNLTYSCLHFSVQLFINHVYKIGLPLS